MVKDPRKAAPGETVAFGLTAEQLKNVVIAIASISFIAYKRGQRSGIDLMREFAGD